MAHLVFGAGYSDEGKGLSTERIRSLFENGKEMYIFRCNAGTNASHRVKTNEYEIVTKHLPSTLVKNSVAKITLIIAPGMVLNLEELFKEVEQRPDLSVLKDKVKIASSIPLVLPGFIALNKAEQSKFGSTNQGTGTTNVSRLKRHCIRLYDIAHAVDEKEFNKICAKIKFSYEQLEISESHENIKAYLTSMVTIYKLLLQYLGDFAVDYTQLIKKINKANCNVLVEGCNGALICNMFGQHPYGTSCMTGPNALLAYTNLDPMKVVKVHGIMGAYICCLNKRVMPTEFFDEEILEQIREKCNETDPAENMVRRLGWFDAPAVRKSLPYDNIVLHLNKLDALTGIKKLKICTHYVIDEEEYEIMPDDEHLLRSIKPVYIELDGWEGDISGCRTCDQLPLNAQKYVAKLEELLDHKIGFIGVGDKIDTYILKD